MVLRNVIISAHIAHLVRTLNLQLEFRICVSGIYFVTGIIQTFFPQKSNWMIHLQRYNNDIPSYRNDQFWSRTCSIFSFLFVFVFQWKSNKNSYVDECVEKFNHRPPKIQCKWEPCNFSHCAAFFNHPLQPHTFLIYVYIYFLHIYFMMMLL